MKYVRLVAITEVKDLAQDHIAHELVMWLVYIPSSLRLDHNDTGPQQTFTKTQKSP